MSDGGPAENEVPWYRTVLGAVLVVVLLFFGVFIFYEWFMPRTTPHLDDPSVLGLVTESRWVIGAIRLVGATLGLYVVLSVIARVSKRQWLSSVGSVKVGEAIDDLATRFEAQEKLIKELERTKQELQQEVIDLVALLESQQDGSLVPEEGGAHGQSGNE